MQPESLKPLQDIRAAAEYILKKTSGKTKDDYLSDDLLRPAVERHFEIIGEALTRLRRDSATLFQIPDQKQIIAFRNLLIHGYDAVDSNRVWDAIENSLPALHQCVVQLLSE